ncbi:xanthine dehydrogenase family protein molybdopterin-binding subunit [Amycolatopsis sp. NPDC006131]|uniref:xanthine dehydrogenase family protein molybdopterin-binding subunit n=1 Tax=Amycolatopsis sp. NPDC006131 TaxID=3156731 RepID=UPI0033ADA013
MTGTTEARSMAEGHGQLRLLSDPNTSRPRRQDGERILTGRAVYLDDVVLPGMLHAAVLRSPHPHARIRSINTSDAEAMPGVRAVITGQRAAELAKPVPHFMDPGVFGLNTAEFPVLPTDKVRWVGEPVAAIAAETQAAAEAACDAIEVEYESLPAVLDAEDALQPGAPRLFEHWTENVIGRFPNGQGDAARRIGEAAHKLSFRLRVGRHQSAPMETRGYIGSWVSPDRIEWWGSTQNPHVLRTRIADTLGLREERVRIVATRLGGAFGHKFAGFAEELIVCVLSRLAGAPVKWIETRADALLVGAREFRHEIEVGFSDDGVLTGLSDRMVANVGSLASWGGWGMCAMSSFTFPGPYRCDGYAVETIPAVTNKAPWSGYRGYGKEQAAVVMERVMDLIAAELDLDPAEVRSRNFWPTDTFPGWAQNKHIDSADYPSLLRNVLELAGYPELRERRRVAQEEGRLFGIGIGVELVPEGGELLDTLVRGHDSATVRVHPSGAVTVLTGVTSPGTGNETTIAHLVARELGIDHKRVDVVQGDTDRCPYGYGNFSSRSITTGGAAAVLAAREIRGQMAAFAGAGWGCDPAEITFAGDLVRRAATGETVGFAELAGRIFVRGSSDPGATNALLEATRLDGPHNFHHEPDDNGMTNAYPSYSSSAVVAVVEVDRATGVVEVLNCCAVGDCGTIINRNFVDGQLHGALAQGIGGVLWEDLPYHADGTPAATTLKEYLVPRASDLPDFPVGHQQTPSPFTVFGAKGAGESGVGASMAAVTNAVNDALAPLRVRVHDLPLTPPTVLAAIERSAST